MFSSYERLVMESLFQSDKLISDLQSHTGLTPTIFMNTLRNLLINKYIITQDNTYMINPEKLNWILESFQHHEFKNIEALRHIEKIIENNKSNFYLRKIYFNDKDLVVFKALSRSMLELVQANAKKKNNASLKDYHYIFWGHEKVENLF